MSARRVAVSSETNGALSEPDYAAAFEITGADGRSPEQWARAVWEGAPRGLRLLLVAGWTAGLGIRLGPRTTPVHVLGWPIVAAPEGTVVLEGRSPILTARNVVEVLDGCVRWTTFVRYERGLARAVWPVATVVHERVMPYLLRNAGTGRTGERKFRAVTSFQRHVLNPLARRLPTQTLLETTGRNSGRRRRTPVGGRRIGDEFWFVSEYGEKSQYVRNIQAQPRVRVRIRGRWHDGHAHPVPEDDARARLSRLPRLNSVAVRVVGTDLLTVRVVLDPRE